MKPLTIDEIKALKKGDWVWATRTDGTLKCYCRVEHAFNFVTYQQDIILRGEDFVIYLGNCGYGDRWFAYKNKEQAETKGEWVELLCNVGDTIYYVAPKGVFPCPVTRIQFTRGLTPSDELIIEIMYEQGDEITAPVYKELSAHSYDTLWFTDKAKADARYNELRGEK